MSASNLAVCPRCLGREKQRIADLPSRAAAGYGVMPLEEFDVLRDEAAKPINEDKLRTFREDYEIYGAETGTVEIAYGGGCRVCDLSVSFTHSLPIPGADEL